MADNLVWLGDHAFLLQLKERGEATSDPGAERSWFKRKVLDKGVRQIKDTLKYLADHDVIFVKNEKGDEFGLRRSELSSSTKLIVYFGSPALPEDCWRIQHYCSRSAGFIHVLAAHDYLGVIEKLRVPEDIKRYFVYRENVVPRLVEFGTTVEEADIMGAFVSEEEYPGPTSKEALGRFIQDAEAFDLSKLLAGISEHIEHAERPEQYYKIMLEFARIPRSMWREIKLRFMKSLDAAKLGKFSLPYRVTYPATDCAFMIAPMPPELTSGGEEGRRYRINGLTFFTHAAKYVAKTGKAVGILVSKDGEYYQIDWMLIEAPWEQDEEMEAKLAESFPFRAVKEEQKYSFYLASEH